MKKRLISILLIAAISISLAGCSSITSILNNITGKASGGITFTRGSWNDNVYTSDFFDVKVPLPENWTIVSDEEIASTFGTEPLTSDTNFSELQAIYDMAMVDLSTGINVIFLAEDLSKALGGTQITEDGYLQNVANMLGDDFTAGDTEDAELGGYTYRKMEVAHSSGSYQEYYIRKVGNYMIGIIGSYLPDYEDIYQAALAGIEKNQ